MKNIILLFLCLLFGGCFSSSDKYVPNEGLNEILIDPEVVEEYLDLSEILQDSIEIIPLETTEQCLISDIKQRILFKYGSKEDVINQINQELTDPVWNDIHQIKDPNIIASPIVQTIINKDRKKYLSYENFCYWCKRFYWLSFP